MKGLSQILSSKLPESLKKPDQRPSVKPSIAGAPLSPQPEATIRSARERIGVDQADELASRVSENKPGLLEAQGNIDEERLRALLGDD